MKEGEDFLNKFLSFQEMQFEFLTIATSSKQQGSFSSLILLKIAI